MQFDKLVIHRRESWQSRPGELSGKLAVKGKHGEIELNLDAKLAEEILKLCAASLVRASQEIATDMTAAVLSGISDPALSDNS